MTRTNRQRGGKSGRIHEEHIDPALLAAICATHREVYHSPEAASAARIQLDQLFLDAGITTRKAYTEKLTQRTWAVRHRSCMENFDAALLIHQLEAPHS